MIDKLKLELNSSNASHKDFADKTKVEIGVLETKIRVQEEDITNLRYELHCSEEQLEDTLTQLNAMEIDFARLTTKNDDDSEDAGALQQQM